MMPFYLTSTCFPPLPTALMVVGGGGLFVAVVRETYCYQALPALRRFVGAEYQMYYDL